MNGYLEIVFDVDGIIGENPLLPLFAVVELAAPPVVVGTYPAPVTFPPATGVPPAVTPPPPAPPDRVEANVTLVTASPVNTTSS